MSDPESPSFHRKSFVQEENRFDDANYWRLPIDQLEFKETTTSQAIDNNLIPTGTEIGINGTLRGFKKPGILLANNPLPSISEMRVKIQETVVPPKRHVIPIVETRIPEVYTRVEAQTPVKIEQDFEIDTALDVQSPGTQPSVPSFEDEIDRHPIRLFDCPLVEVEQTVQVHSPAEQLQEPSYRSFDEGDAYDRRPYRLFNEEADRDVIVVVTPQSTGSPNRVQNIRYLPPDRTNSLLSKEVVANRNRIYGGSSNPTVMNKLLSPVTSNTTLGSETGRESATSKPSPPKYDQEDIDYNKSTENLKKRFWFKWIMFWRSLIMTVHTWWTVYPGLENPIVLSLGGKNLLITILAFSTLDLVLAFIKAFPKQLWVCWSIREWNPVKQLGNVWAILADHELLLNVVPLLCNLSLRVYSYRLTELVQNPSALNSITNSSFTLSEWANPEYHNLVQMILWGVSICATMIFTTGLRMKFFIVRYSSISLGILIAIKSLLLLFDMVTTSLFLYTFLVSLGLNLFGNSPDIPLMLAIMISSPVISTICNSFINLPLLYSFKRIKGKKSAFEIAKDCANNLFTVRTTTMSIFAVFYIAVTGYLLNQLKLITANDTTSPAAVLSLVQWTPQQVVVSMVIVNLTANYLIGVAFNLIYWAIRLSLYLVPGIFG